MIAKRWQVSEDGVTWVRQVYPENLGKLRLTDSRDLDAGQAFFRRKLNTALIFSDKNGARDFTYFRSLETRRNARCRTLYIRVQMQCSSVWQTLWTGEFSTGSGKWDLTNCLFEVKPEVVDRYSCLLKKQGVKRNVLNTEVVNANVVAFPPGMEISWGYSGGGLPESQGWAEVDTQTLTRPTIGPYPGGNVTNEIYWRETITTLCVDGIPVQPAGDGWEQVTGSFCSDGFVKWARQPLIAWPFPDNPLYVGPVGDTTAEPPTSPTCNNWILIDAFNPPGTGIAGIYLCLDDAESQYQINRGRRLSDVLTALIEQSECGLSGIRSDFFEIDPPGTAIGYEPGFNYVTGETNRLDNLLLFQKSDVIDPDASNPATIGNMSLKELMTMLRIMFQCMWDIDAQGYMRIEHWKHWTFGNGMDLSDMESVKEPISYEHLSSEVPQVERMSFMEARAIDFVGNDILYSGPCAKSEDVKEYTPGKVTTDIGYILSEPTAISKDGFVLASTRFNGTDYDVDVSDGAITGSPVTNGALSTANLMRDYWTWNRFLPSGNMNGSDVDFDSFLDNIEQSNVRASLCCKLFAFDPKRTIATSLGSQWLGGIRAKVVEAEHELDTCRTTLTLSYAY